MSENREFIAAKDLPTTEAEEVSVLCLENGELKQKAAKGLGGGGGGYILRPTADEVEIADAGDMQAIDITTNCDDLLKCVENGGSAYVLIPGEASQMGVPMLSLVQTIVAMVQGEEVIAVGFITSITGTAMVQFLNCTYRPNFAAEMTT